MELKDLQLNSSPRSSTLAREGPLLDLDAGGPRLLIVTDLFEKTVGTFCVWESFERSRMRVGSLRKGTDLCLLALGALVNEEKLHSCLCGPRLHEGS